MSHETIQHRTTTMERHLKATPARVFEMWADAEKRAVWTSPSSEIHIKMEAADFSEGGRDISLCYMGDEVLARVIADYHDIVANKRIVFTETISDMETRHGVSLVSVEFQEQVGGTGLIVTLQTLALDGGPLLEEVVMGWESSLASLEGVLQA